MMAWKRLKRNIGCGAKMKQQTKLHRVHGTNFYFGECGHITTYSLGKCVSCCKTEYKEKRKLERIEKKEKK